MFARGQRFVKFWREKGSGAAIHLIRQKVANLVAGRPAFSPTTPGNLKECATARELFEQHFAETEPLRAFVVPKGMRRRVSVITDSIGAGSLFGGVGTALILAARLANRLGATLRIVTRTERAIPSNAALVLNAYGIQLAHEMQFAFAPLSAVSTGAGALGLDVQSDELFITTSWWSTAATLGQVPSESIVYLLQEDERMFYPFGEDRLRCEEVLRNRDIRFVVNTRLLHTHLLGTGLEHLATHGHWFEPAFPDSLFCPRPAAADGKKKMFYYARPHNPRNLFHIGLQVIESAVRMSVLDLDRWDVYLVGKDIPSIVFGNGYVPKRCEGLNWQAYADLIGTIDLGLSLMYTPHPSYPPLDLAASGAVVVTNRFGPKQDLSGYSRNIICAEPEVGALVAALAEGVALAENAEQRRSNYEANGLCRDWAQSFESTLEALAPAR